MDARHVRHTDERHTETYLPDPRWFVLAADCTCDKCVHWAHSREFPAYARINGSTVRVAQCLMAGLDDAAPYAETLGEESAVFTQAMSRCAAFDLTPELAQDLTDDLFSDGLLTDGAF